MHAAGVKRHRYQFDNPDLNSVVVTRSHLICD
jgi:hypothetical protein